MIWSFTDIKPIKNMNPQISYKLGLKSYFKIFISQKILPYSLFDVQFEQPFTY